MQKRKVGSTSTAHSDNPSERLPAPAEPTPRSRPHGMRGWYDRPRVARPCRWTLLPESPAPTGSDFGDRKIDWRARAPRPAGESRELVACRLPAEMSRLEL